MARSTMLALIARTRTLISDSAFPQTFTDDVIQNALDARRAEQRFVALRAMPTFQPGGAVVYLDYYADTEDWEDDYVLQNISYATITATTAEPIVGHWQFASQPAGIAVHITGKTYDLYGSAADLLEAWAATVMLDFAVTADRDVYARNQKFEMISNLALQYRKKALVQSSPITQSDAALDYESGNAVVYPSVSSIYGT